MTRVRTEPLWTAGDVADFLGVPVSTLGLSPERCFWPDSPDLRVGEMGTVSNDIKYRGSTEED